MFEITKDRNLLYIRLYEAQTNPYVLDINTGIFLGQQGNPIKTTPKYWSDNLFRAKESVSTVNHPLGNLVYALYYITVRRGDRVTTAFRQHDGYRNLLGLCDRFQSIGYCMSYDDVRDLCGVPIPDSVFRAFAKYHKDNPTARFCEWKRNNALAHWCAENGIAIDDHFTAPMAELIRQHISNTNHIKWYAYYLSRGLYDFGELNGCKSSVMHWISVYLDRVERMGQEPQKGDFIRLYNDAVRTYELRKIEFDNRAIAEHQNSRLHALQFEDDQFIVRVPMTSAEFIAEGEAQHNCVGRLYLPKVIEHIRHIVFVRQKSDPDKPFITCEIYNDGSMGMYLLQYNNDVERDSDAYRFKLKYQEFLNNHWDRA
jgi:hypothetical protein